MTSTDTTDQLGLFADPIAERAAAEAAEHARLWQHDAERRLAGLILAGADFDAHTLTEQGLPDPPRRRLMSGLFTSAHRSGLIEKVGYHPSRRATSGAVVAVWRGTVQGREHARHLLRQGAA